MTADNTLATCDCGHDVGNHGITLLSELTGEFAIAGCYQLLEHAKDRYGDICGCLKFKFREENKKETVIEKYNTLNTKLTVEKGASSWLFKKKK